MNWLTAGLVAAAWGGMTLATLYRHRVRAEAGQGGSESGGLLIGYASQSGTAEALARAEAAARGARVLSLDLIGAEELGRARRALFYISTTGDGDAPDNGTAFLSRVMEGRPALGTLSYALLALGDRNYPRFCGFAHRVDAWLRQCGATPFLPLTEVDRDQPQALARWREGLGSTTTGDEGFTRWRLRSRRHLNPGSPGGPLWHLVLEPEGALAESIPDWQAGDIATIEIPGPGSMVRRDYSLASLSQSGAAELILREVLLPGGEVGQGSHWLTRRLQPGEAVSLRIRANPGFRAEGETGPMLLIGNGSGLAGLMSHLRHRAGQAAGGPVWLIHGERSPEHDAIFHDELEELRGSGRLQRLDRSFSRGAGACRYVQDILRIEAAAVRAHVAQGGTIWLCGRREGMATDVMAALGDILGAGAPDQLMREGRLKRDVY